MKFFLRVNRPCHLFGQCSEICGVNHAFMPIHVQTISPYYMEDYILREITLDYRYIPVGSEGIVE
jgi:heme/copper-type cytochrome/quinol oxidase subunit 2